MGKTEAARKSTRKKKADAPLAGLIEKGGKKMVKHEGKEYPVEESIQIGRVTHNYFIDDTNVKRDFLEVRSPHADE